MRSPLAYRMCFSGHHQILLPGVPGVMSRLATRCQMQGGGVPGVMYRLAIRCQMQGEWGGKVLYLTIPRGGTLPYELFHDAFNVTYQTTWFPPPTDRCLWKHHLPATSFAGGKKEIKLFALSSQVFWDNDKDPFTPAESEKDQRTNKKVKEKTTNIKENFWFRPVWMGLNWRCFYLSSVVPCSTQLKWSFPVIHFIGIFYSLYLKTCKIEKSVTSIWIQSIITNVNLHWTWFSFQLFPIFTY